MYVTKDGHWQISEGQDSADLWAIWDTCNRCGIRIFGPQNRALHDDFHTRVGD